MMVLSMSSGSDTVCSMRNLLEGLNSAQRSAVEHGDGPLLIVAGAGTGKTTVLTRRYVRLLFGTTEATSQNNPSTAVQPSLTTENLLALTFTEKAAQEMEDRVLELLPNGAYDFWISTFHEFCQRILEKYALEIGLPTQFRILNETDAWLLLKRRIHELPLNHYRPLGNPVKFLSHLLKHFSRAKDEGITPERYLEFSKNAALDGDAEFVTGERARLKEIADCYFAYQQILREESAFDFADLITETLRLLNERPHVLKELQKRFAHVLVDEFQDTNWAQYELIKLITGNAGNLTVVGDDDQAIYKFRGASLANILQFRDDFQNCATVTLTENYRSRQKILDRSYEIITKNNPNRLEVRLADTGLVKKLKSHRGEGGSVDVAWYKSLQDETEGVAAKILSLKEANPTLAWNEIAILSRSNDGATPFTDALERHGIPFRFFALRGLYAKPVVVDITAIFSLLDGTRESSAVWRVMASSAYTFSAKEIAQFLQYARRKRYASLWGSLESARMIPDLGREGQKRAETLVAHVQNLSEAARRETPLRMLQLTLDKTGYLSTVMDLPESEKIESIGNLNGFAERIRRYEQSTHAPTLKGFMEEFRLEIDSGEEGSISIDPNEGPNLVKVLTVHASKGLEFDHVFIISLVDQRFPTRERHHAIPLPDGLINERLPERDTHLEEERRLLYVAMTRAKDSVTLTGAEQYSGLRKKKPSIFLQELGFNPSHLQARASSALLSLLPPEQVPTAELTAEQEIYPLKRRFSFTQLAAFRSCPLQYKFAHVYKIPILGSYQKSFGQCIHLTLQEILQLHIERGKATQENLFSPSSELKVKVGLRVPLEEALEIYEKRWAENDDWYENHQRYKEYHAKGTEAVKAMIGVWQTSVPDIAYLERPFDWRVGDHSLKGKVDRIDHLPGEKFGIIDYKTGAAKHADSIETKDKEQLWIYQISMEEMGLPVSSLKYVYVLTGEETAVNLLQGERREKFCEDTLRRMKEILLSKFTPSPSPFICKYCDFRHICEYRRL